MNGPMMINSMWKSPNLIWKKEDKYQRDQERKKKKLKTKKKKLNMSQKIITKWSWMTMILKNQPKIWLQLKKC